ncbi:MAG: lytic transglycosylase domain-containing protein [Microscillaceae bacterium]
MLSTPTLFASTDPDSLEITNTQSSDGPQAEAALDSLYSSLLKGYVPTLHPAMVRDRLTCMKSQIQMTYHEDVMGWIKFYTVKNRDYTQRILERSTFYFPIFEEALARHGMPDELKYLSIVESALRPEAESWAAAAGLWQFIPSTGKEYGLEQDWFIDERMDIYKSTDAACRYLKFLYKYHGDWQLALAAYNCGPGRVNWAVKQAGGKDANFWKIYNFLPRETRSYVPAFIAASYAMKYADEHFIQAKNPQTFIPSDTILVSQFLNLEEFARQIEVPVEQMQMLNPHLRKKAIPAYKQNYPLRYPAAKRELVQANRVAILQACNRASLREMPYTAGKTDLSSTTEGKKALTHTVKAGESINYIALQYKVAGSSIRVWNRLASDLIYPNQKLTIWVKTEESPTKTAPAEVAQEAAPTKP